MPTGPNGEDRPQSDVENAMKVGRVSVGLDKEDADTPKRETRVLLRNWRRPDEESE